jgi:16S rRNA processing protein RimM
LNSINQGILAAANNPVAEELSTDLNGSTDASARLRVGRITGAHGLRGALRLRPDNPDSDTLEQVRRVFIEAAAEGSKRPRAAMDSGASREFGKAQEFKLIRAERVNAAAIRLTLEGLDDPDAAEALRGASVSVLISDLPPKEPGEFYYYEAIGCSVATTDGRLIGVIEDVIATGANDVWVVRDGATEVLVPVIENVVKSMDLGARRMVVEAVPGLLD